MPHRNRWTVLATTALAVLAVAPAAAAASSNSHPGVRHVRTATAGSTRLRLSWRNPGAKHFTATIVRYARGDHAPAKPTSGTRAGRVSAAHHELTVGHLASATRYTFSLFAYYRHGHYSRRVTVHATTGPAPAVLVQPFDRGTYVSITWRPPSSRTYSATVVRYAAGHRAPSSLAQGQRVHLSSAKATEARLAHLPAHTAYSVSIWTRDRAHHYSSVATTHFTTLGTVAPPTGTVSGTVTDNGTPGRPLAGVQIQLYDWTSGQSYSAITDSDGKYAITAPAGDDELVFYGQDATGGNSDATGYVGDDKQVLVSAGRSTSASTALDPGAAVTGHVTDATGNALHGVVAYPRSPTPYVNVGGWLFGFFNDYTGAPDTAADGSFTVKGLPAAAVQICYDPTVQQVTGGDFDHVGYTGRCEHTSLAAAAGSTVTLPPVALVQADGGSVLGHVTDSAGHPLSGAIVQVTAHDVTSSASGTALTDAGGGYRVDSLPAGTYDVCVDPSTVVVAGFAAGDALTCRFAVAALTVGTTSTVNVRLHAGGAAAGRLFGPGGHPVVGAQVRLGQAATGAGGWATTDATGQFEVKHLVPGKYVVCFDASAATVSGTPSGVLSNCFHGGEVVEVRAGGIRLGLDTALSAGGAISGTVVNADAAHTPAVGADVTAEIANDNGDGFGSWATTDAHGHYLITGLAPGSYGVCSTPADIVTFGDGTCRSPVSVRVGATTRNVDMTLSAGGTITATVTDGDGHPVSGVDVAVVTSCGPDDECGSLPLFDAKKEVAVVGSGITDGAGTITFPQLSPTAGSKPNYAVCVFAYYGATSTGEPAGGYLDTCTSSGTFGITLRAGKTDSEAFALLPAGEVHGRVTDPNGHPLAGVRIAVSHSSSTDYLDPSSDFSSPFGGPSGPQGDVTTDADGTYVVRGVQPGDQRVCVDAGDAVDTTGPATPTGFLDQCVGGQPGSTDGGTAVTVAAGGSVDAGQLKLTVGAAISGKMVDYTTKRAIPRAQVLVIDGIGESIAGTATDGSGNYLITRLPADDDTVCFWADGYRMQCYDGVSWNGGPVPTGVTHVTTTAGTVAHLKDARMKKG